MGHGITRSLDNNTEKRGVDKPFVKISAVAKFRPWLIELTSFKPKLLIRFIRNKTCKNKQTSISCQNHAAEK